MATGVWLLYINAALYYTWWLVHSLVCTETHDLHYYTFVNYCTNTNYRFTVSTLSRYVCITQ